MDNIAKFSSYIVYVIEIYFNKYAALLHARKFVLKELISWHFQTILFPVSF